MTFPTESAMLKHVVAHLQRQGYDVYQELRPDHPDLSGCPDILAVKREDLIISVEGKLRMTSELIKQGVNWLGWVDQSWLAVPAPQKRTSAWAKRVLDAVHHGIGVMVVHENGRCDLAGRPSPCQNPNRTVFTKQLERGTAPKAMKPAGSPGMARTVHSCTKFDPLREFLAEAGEATLLDCWRALGPGSIRGLRTGKRPWMNDIEKVIEQRGIDGVVAERQGGRLVLRLEKNSEIDSSPP
jgi:hypothetical protein